MDCRYRFKLLLYFFRVPVAIPQRIKLKALFTCHPLMNLVFRLARFACYYFLFAVAKNVWDYFITRLTLKGFGFILFYYSIILPLVFQQFISYFSMTYWPIPIIRPFAIGNRLGTPSFASSTLIFSNQNFLEVTITILEFGSIFLNFLLCFDITVFMNSMRPHSCWNTCLYRRIYFTKLLQLLKFTIPVQRYLLQYF